jgi:DNA-binding NtrC family response regulator
VQVDVRVVAATNKNLEEEIERGNFREDLFYRLNVIELEIPALAERRDDIGALARHFLQPGFALAQDALDALSRYPWPGNVRELQNTIRRACLLSSDKTIGATALVLPAVAAPPAASEETPEDTRLDRGTIEQALQRAEGVVAQAARELGLSRQALYRRMEKLGLKAPVMTSSS